LYALLKHGDSQADLF